MSVLERLFLLEVEFYRRLRTQGFGNGEDGAGVRTSYAMQCGYEGLIRAMGGTIRPRDLERVRERLRLAGDVRDLLAARDSVLRILGRQPVIG